MGKQYISPVRSRVQPTAKAEQPRRASGDHALESEPMQRPVQPAFSGLSGDLHRELRSPGQPLPTDLRHEMETAYGTDFSDVRIHAGETADQLDAAAFTRGNQIGVPSGKANFDTPDGKRVLGHELAHVIQQRAGRVPAQSGINADPRLEAEADRMGAKAASGESVTMPGIQAGIGGSTPQGAPVQLAKHKKFKDSDLDPNVPVRNAIGGGAINQVDLVTYNQSIGRNTPTGYFKADFQKEKIGKNQYTKHDIGDVAAEIGIDETDPKLANRAVATSRIASLLTNPWGQGPGNTIAATAFASHARNGATVEGSVSEQASGRALKTGVMVRVTDQGMLNNLTGSDKNLYLNPAEGKPKYRSGDATKKLHPTQKQNPTGPDEYEDPTAFYNISQHDYYHQFNFQDPEIQRGLSDLQILDAITGQVDRHGENIFIDPNGKVTGIDNDAAFGKNIADPAQLVNTGQPFDRMKASHNKGLPPLVDYTTAKMVLDLKPKQVEKELKKLLSPDEIHATIARLGVVQHHIRDLYARGDIVRGSDYFLGNSRIRQRQQWDVNTYNTMIQAGPNTSYLAQAVDRYTQESLKGPQHAEGAPVPQPVVANNVAPQAVPNGAVNPVPNVANLPQVIPNQAVNVANPAPIVANPAPIIANPAPIVANQASNAVNPPQVVANPPIAVNNNNIANPSLAVRNGYAVRIPVRPSRSPLTNQTFNPQLNSNEGNNLVNPPQVVANPHLPVAVNNNNSANPSLAVRNGYAVRIPVDPMRSPLTDQTFVNPNPTSEIPDPLPGTSEPLLPIPPERPKLPISNPVSTSTNPSRRPLPIPPDRLKLPTSNPISNNPPQKPLPTPPDRSKLPTSNPVSTSANPPQNPIAEQTAVPPQSTFDGVLSGSHQGYVYRFRVSDIASSELRNGYVYRTLKTPRSPLTDQTFVPPQPTSAKSKPIVREGVETVNPLSAEWAAVVEEKKKSEEKQKAQKKL